MRTKLTIFIAALTLVFAFSAWGQMDSRFGPDVKAGYVKINVFAGSGTTKVISRSLSGTFWTNRGATGASTFQLPKSETGMRYGFITATAQSLYVKPYTGDIIVALTGHAGDRILNATAGNTVMLTCYAPGYWVAESIYGTWSDAGG
jgi:hypothetical protein